MPGDQQPVRRRRPTMRPACRLPLQQVQAAQEGALARAAGADDGNDIALAGAVTLTPLEHGVGCQSDLWMSRPSARTGGEEVSDAMCALVQRHSGNQGLSKLPLRCSVLPAILASRWPGHDPAGAGARIQHAGRAGNAAACACTAVQVGDVGHQLAGRDLVSPGRTVEHQHTGTVRAQPRVRSRPAASARQRDVPAALAGVPASTPRRTQKVDDQAGRHLVRPAHGRCRVHRATPRWRRSRPARPETVRQPHLPACSQGRACRLHRTGRRRNRWPTAAPGRPAVARQLAAHRGACGVSA